MPVGGKDRGPMADFDLAIIGGGISGVGIARDAAGRGVRGLGFEYSDCQVDDSRLVVLNVVDAAARGATVRTRTRVARADRADGLWRLVLNRRGRRQIVSARVLVNAAGPWVNRVAELVLRM